MFYRPEDGHGLPHNPLNAIVSPRPIGWISTRSAAGVANLAPYSFFNAVAYVPPQVMYSSTGVKDNVTNIRETGVFCANIVEHAAIDKMNASSKILPPEVDEFEYAGIEKAPCVTIDCDRVANAPASLECRMTQIVDLKGTNFLVIGEVTGVHIRDDALRNGLFDVTTFNPVARMGYRYYSVIRDVFELARPDEK